MQTYPYGEQIVVKSVDDAEKIQNCPPDKFFLNCSGLSRNFMLKCLQIPVEEEKSIYKEQSPYLQFIRDNYYVLDGLITRLGELDFDERRRIYLEVLKVNREKYNEADVIKRQSIVFGRYKKYIEKMSKERLVKFIDDVFDRQMKTKELFG